MSDPLDDMYREIILDHYKAPRGKRPLDDKDIESDGHNPSCGDELTMQLKVDKDNIVQDVHVDCKGCAISVASGSMLAEYIKGKPLNDVKRISEAIKKMLKGEETDIPEDLGDIDSLKGVRNFPVRIKCALLAWMTLIEGVKNFETGTKPGSFTVSTEDDKKEH
ncbi:MAG: SUF system NifU family Fe-S cluster assembly protein [Calditrichaeota bacterium]|nr:MAG: SUF system NifU family Fe-S cluster assembly protein [Calditrichota bacterium]